ncbi:YeeE/YedE family protein [Methylobacter sp. BlB1]|uniref:YeeE/YedE family protein n=1 Tax=Methylobacter sp. BlB1 TaxID=2785914 RepID=UPI001893074E|nr:YeeE/YedE family protein [Methylobacter sp. BlB1]MBF6650638.1 YeeE/YedE family protein [Methylobacter sp. BlB1]
MENFTPYSALAGGGLIGLSAGLLWLFNGRVAGISGITGGLFSSRGRDIGWRLCFLAGLLLGPLMFRAVGDETASLHISPSLAVLSIAGLLVGYGTGLGNGCTSGHGICGLTRLSPRSVAATLTFMIVAAVTVYIVRHWPGAGSW